MTQYFQIDTTFSKPPRFWGFNFPQRHLAPEMLPRCPAATVKTKKRVRGARGHAHSSGKTLTFASTAGRWRWVSLVTRSSVQGRSSVILRAPLSGQPSFLVGPRIHAAAPILA